MGRTFCKTRAAARRAHTMRFYGDEKIKYPESKLDHRQGAEEKERSRNAKQKRLAAAHGYVLAAFALILLSAFADGGWRYYRTNVLPETYYRRASELFDAGDYAAAGTRYEKALELRPARRDLFRSIASCREKLGDKESAARYYEKYLESDPEDVKTMARLGWLYMERGDYNAALKWFREAAKREKKDAALWRLTAQAGGAKSAANAGKFAAYGEEPARLCGLASAVDGFSLTDFCPAG